LGSHEISFILFSFAIGSIPIGFLICLFKEKKDIRNEGSKNTGATNVFRVCGKRPALLTLLLDMTKGALPTLYGIIHFNSTFMIILGASAAIIGHLFSPFLKFRGGKGISTFTGFLIVYSFKSEGFPAMLVFSVLFITVCYLSGFVSLSSLIGISGAFFAILFTNSVETSVVVFAVILLMIYKHRNNIQRLLSGDEEKLFRRNNG